MHEWLNRAQAGLDRIERNVDARLAHIEETIASRIRTMEQVAVNLIEPTMDAWLARIEETIISLIRSLEQGAVGLIALCVQIEQADRQWPLRPMRDLLADAAHRAVLELRLPDFDLPQVVILFTAAGCAAHIAIEQE